MSDETVIDVTPATPPEDVIFTDALAPLQITTSPTSDPDVIEFGILLELAAPIGHIHIRVHPYLLNMLHTALHDLIHLTPEEMKQLVDATNANTAPRKETTHE